MKDDVTPLSPNLSGRAGKREVEGAVAAAVAGFGALAFPGDREVREFADLVVPLWDEISPAARRALGAALSHSRRVPRELIDRFLQAPVEVSAPFLVSSPALEPGDIAALAASGDDRLTKLLAARRPAGGKAAPSRGPAKPTEPVQGHGVRLASTGGGLRAFTEGGGEAPERRPLVPAPPLVPEHLTKDAPTPPRDAAATARETLRRLATGGKRGGGAAAADPLAQMIAHAVDGDADAVYANLGGLLTLTPERVGRIAADASGEALAVALKALRLGAADAMTVLMMMKPSVGLNVRAFAAMKQSYRALKVDDCREILGLVEAPTAVPKLRRQYQDVAPVSRGAAPTQFGRRASRPVVRQTSSKRR